MAVALLCSITLIADIFLNLILPTVDVFTDWVFFLGNVLALNVDMRDDVTNFKSSQERCKYRYSLHTYVRYVKFYPISIHTSISINVILYSYS